MSTATDLAIPVNWFGTMPHKVGTGQNQPFAVALWRLDRDAILEFRAEAMPQTHMICAHLSGSKAFGGESGAVSTRAPSLNPMAH